MQRNLLRLTLWLVLLPGAASAQFLLQEDFNVPSGQSIGNTGWSNECGSPDIMVGPMGLVYPGYIGSGIGNAAQVMDVGLSNGASYNRMLSGSGSPLFVGFLIQVQTASSNPFSEGSGCTNGTPTILTFGDGGGGNGNDHGLIVRDMGGGTFQFGLYNGSAPFYTPVNYPYNQTFLLVLQLGACNMNLYVNPPLGVALPGPIVAVGLSSCIGSGDRLHLSARSQTNLMIDGIRVSNNPVDVLVTTPSSQATALTFSSVNTTSMQVNWTSGNGNGRLVLAKAGAPVDDSPVDGTIYSANNVFGNGSQIGVGNYVVYSGSGTFENVFNLPTQTTIHYQVFEYNQVGTSYLFNTSPAAGNPAFQSTLFNEPASAASSITIPTAGLTTATINWIPGSGTERIVVVGTNITTATPTDGTVYGANANFVLAPPIGTGNKIVYSGPGNSVDVTGLASGTTYGVRVFEVNPNSGSLASNYLTNFFPESSFCTEPSSPSIGLNRSSVSTNTMTVAWTSGNGSGRLVLAKQGAPVDAAPLDGTLSYGASGTFGSGTQIGTGNFVVYNGSGSFVDLSGLTAGGIYHFQVFEYCNTGSYYNYGVAGPPMSFGTLFAQPTTQATTVTFSAVTANSLTVNWTNGNGSHRIVVARATSPVSFTPNDGVVYTANSNFTSAIDQGSGNKVVYSGTGSSANVTGLVPGTAYSFRVFEANPATPSDQSNFNIVTATNNPMSTLTTEPASQASNLAVSNVQNITLTLNWTSGSGTNRIVIMDNAAVTFTPVDATGYAANSNYSAGTDLGSGQKCVYNGSGSSANISGLTANTVYHFRVYEYNGSDLTANYNINTATLNPTSRTTTAAEPSIQANNITFSAVQTGSLTLNWTSGNGTSRLVVMDDAAVAFTPVDGTDYPANNDYTLGTDLGSGQKSVFSGSASTVNIAGLLPNVTYHFRVFEYNGNALTANYNLNTSTNNPNSRATPFAAPTTQATAIAFTSPLTNGFTISWTNGSGTGRVVIVDDAAIAFTPTIGNALTANADYSLGTDLGSGQKCVYSGSGTSVPVTGLAANTTYHVRVFEFNGSGIQINYITTASTGNPTSRKTLTPEPTAHPASLTATASSSSQINLAFSAASTITNAAGFIVLRRSDGTNPTSTGVIDGTAPGSLSLAAGTTLVTTITSTATTAFNDTGLASGVQYNYALVPYGFDGSSNDTYNYRTAATIQTANATTFVVEPSAQPTAMVFSTVTPTTYTVSFTAPASVPAGYIAFRKTVSSPVTAIPVDGTTYTVGANHGDATVAYIGSSPTFNETSLTAATVYFYDIFAYNGSGGLTNYLTTGPLEGSQSTLSNPPTNPPTALIFSAVQATTMTTSFTASAGGATGYVVLRRAGSAPTGSPSDGLTYTVGGTIVDGDVIAVGASVSIPQSSLTANTTYHYRVFAYNGSGANTNYLTASFLSGSQLTLPAAPASLPASGPGQTSFTANWNAMAGITNFFIDVSLDNFSTYATGFQNQAVTGTSVSVTGLTAGATYKYRLRAGNAAGQSANSADQPVLLIPAQPTATGATTITQSSFVANWNAVTGVANYHLDVARDAGFTDFVNGFNNLLLGPGTLSQVVNLLAPGVTYYYQVRASNTTGTSPSSTTVTVPTIPSPPVVVIPTDTRAETSFLVTWAAVIGADGYYMDVYDITAAPVPVPGYINKQVSGVSHTVTGLSSDTYYSVVMRSFNTSGASGDGETIYTKTLGPGPDNKPSVTLGSTATSASVTASVSGGSDPKTIVFYHRKITDVGAFTAEPPTAAPSGTGTYAAAVEASFLDEIGMEYYFIVTDRIGFTSTSDKGYVYKPVANQAIPGLSSGGQLENYRIFSIPLDFGTNNTIEEVLAPVIAQFQGNSKEKWRLVRYQNGRNVDFPEGLLRIDKGKAYWINSIDPIDMQVSGSVIPANQNSAFTLPLEDGWNQVGNPFTFDVSWADVMSINSAVGQLYVYNPAVKFDQSDNLRAWGGGFVHSNGTSTLTIPVTVAKASGRTRGSQPAGSDLGADDWFVPLKLEQGQATHDLSGIGMNPGASGSFDRLDELSLPRFVKYLELNVYHPENKWKRFMRDVVPTGPSYTWNLNVESNWEAAETRITWDRSAFGDNDATLWLYDGESQSLVDMRQHDAYSFTGSGPRNLKIMYARTAADLAPGFADVGRPYPNPFREILHIPVVLQGGGSSVDFSVFDMTGRKVSGAVIESLPAGIHRLEWDASAGDVPGGIYIYRVRLGDGTVRQGKIVLRKN